mgnify:CR=1 FL=1
MFVRMIRKAFLRQWKKMAMIAFTIALGASLATAMLSVMMDVEDKINQELKAYGANITVVPKDTSIINDIYDVGDASTGGSYLNEDELGKIKTIFWAFNIVDYAPFVSVEATLNNSDSVTVMGTWFNHHMDLPTGEQLDAGVRSLRSWWEITDGDWIDEQKSEDGNVCMVGSALANKDKLKAGDILHLSGSESDLEPWSRDWNQFNQKNVGKNEAEGLSDKELIEYLKWMACHKPDKYAQVMVAFMKAQGVTTVSMVG